MWNDVDMSVMLIQVTNVVYVLWNTFWIWIYDLKDWICMWNAVDMSVLLMQLQMLIMFCEIHALFLIVRFWIWYVVGWFAMSDLLIKMYVDHYVLNYCSIEFNYCLICENVLRSDAFYKYIYSIYVYDT